MGTYSLHARGFALDFMSDADLRRFIRSARVMDADGNWRELTVDELIEHRATLRETGARAVIPAQTLGEIQMSPKKKAAEEFLPEQPTAAEFETDASKAFAALARRNRANEIVSDRSKLVLGPGEPFIGRLVGMRTAQGDKSDYYVYDFDTESGEELFLLSGGDLEQKIKGDMVGHVLGLCYSGHKDVGRQTPMKVVTVFDFGLKFPK